MGSSNSSKSTRRLAESLATEVGAFHFAIEIDTVVAAFVAVFQAALGSVPKFVKFGGNGRQDVALQVYGKR